MTISRRKFLKISLASAVSTALAGVGGFAYAHDIETGWIEIVFLDLTLPRLSPSFDGYKLVQFSDIHVDGGKTNDHVKRVVELVNAQQPDAITITGDFVTHTNAGGISQSLVEPLSQLVAKDITVAILGNHDHWTDAEGVRAVLRQSGITDLSNTTYTIERDGEVLHLAGVDDYWERLDRLDDVLARLPDDGAAVLLAHEPDYADISAASGRFDLQIFRSLARRTGCNTLDRPARPAHLRPKISTRTLSGWRYDLVHQSWCRHNQPRRTFQLPPGNHRFHPTC